MRNDKLHRYNLTHEDCLKEISEISSQNKPYYENICIRAVMVKDEKNNTNPWRNAMCTVKILPQGVKQTNNRNYIYDDIRLFEYWTKAENLLSVLDDLKNEGIKTNSHTLLLGDVMNFREVRYHPHHNSYSDIPGYLYSTSSLGEHINIPHHPLLRYDNPYYKDPYVAISEWCELYDFNGDHDIRLGTGMLFLPECREYFEELKYDIKDKTLYVTIKKGKDNLSMYLKGEYKSPYGYKSINKSIKSKIEVLKILPEEAETMGTFEMYLIDKNSHVFDFHIEDKYESKNGIQIFGIISDKTKLDVVKEALKLCENEQIEFKPYIRKGNEKAAELIETAIAFANTDGGRIFIGIDNHAAIKGVDADIKKEAKKQGKDFDSTLQEYIGYVRQTILDGLNKTLPLKISAQVYAGKTLIIIEVPKGNRKPYAKLSSRDIYIRKGANNVKPDPDTELVKLYNQSEQLSDYY